MSDVTWLLVAGFAVGFGWRLGTITADAVCAALRWIDAMLGERVV